MLLQIDKVKKCIDTLRKNPNILSKKEICKTYKHIGNSVKSSVYFSNENELIYLGDDAAAIPQQDGSHLLMAAEGIVSYFLEKDPWFAGYSSIMVNISDICAMGGLPISVTDTLYAANEEDTKEIWEGMMAASNAYGIPIVGGHTCYHSNKKALSVSILGKATDNLLTSFNAAPGDVLLLAIDLDGVYYKDYSFWNASTNATPEKLQALVKIPHTIANKKLSTCAKDVSMGGIVGTLLMLMATSNVGAELFLSEISKPVNVTWAKWLSSFPSYAYLISCKKEHVSLIKKEFSHTNINCETIGCIIEGSDLIFDYKNEKIKF